jgi:hypothetical protein
MASFFGKRGSQPQPVQHVIGKEHFRLLESLGIAPDGPENVIPSQNDIDERLAQGRANLDRRIEVLHKNLAAQVGPEITMRPFWLIPESCWQEETGAFLLKFLDFNPYDNWNIAFLPADQLTSLIIAMRPCIRTAKFQRLPLPARSSSPSALVAWRRRRARRADRGVRTRHRRQDRREERDYGPGDDVRWEADGSAQGEQVKLKLPQVVPASNCRAGICRS